MLIGPEHKVTRGSIGISFASAVSAASAANTASPTGRPGQLRHSRQGRSQGRHQVRRRHRLHRWQAHQGRRPAGRRHLRAQGRLHRPARLPPRRQAAHRVGMIGDRSQLGEDASNADDNAAPAESDAGEGKLGIKVDRGSAPVRLQARHQGRRHRHHCAGPAPSPTRSVWKRASSSPRSTGSPSRCRRGRVPGRRLRPEVWRRRRLCSAHAQRRRIWPLPLRGHAPVARSDHGTHFGKQPALPDHRRGWSLGKVKASRM
jgi:hypothetical protein